MSESEKSSGHGAESGASATTPLEFVQQLWAGMQVPGMSLPNLAAGDITKQIADLKTVESWLTLNMSLLRGTIQALEVQAATIATLQTMYQSMQTAGQAETNGPDGAAACATSTPFFSPFAPQFAAAFQPPFGFAPPSPTSPMAQQAGADAGKKEDVSAAGNAAFAAAAPFGTPAAWWDLLQQQFKQTVDAALKQQATSAPAAEKSGATMETSADADKGDADRADDAQPVRKRKAASKAVAKDDKRSR